MTVIVRKKYVMECSNRNIGISARQYEGNRKNREKQSREWWFIWCLFFSNMKPRFNPMDVLHASFTYTSITSRARVRADEKSKHKIVCSAAPFLSNWIPEFTTNTGSFFFIQQLYVVRWSLFHSFPLNWTREHNKRNVQESIQFKYNPVFTLPSKYGTRNGSIWGIKSISSIQFGDSH